MDTPDQTEWLESFVGKWRDEILHAWVEAKEECKTEDVIAFLRAKELSDDPQVIFVPRAFALNTPELKQLFSKEILERISVLPDPNPGFDHTIWVLVGAARRMGCIRLSFKMIEINNVMSHEQDPSIQFGFFIMTPGNTGFFHPLPISAKESLEHSLHGELLSPLIAMMCRDGIFLAAGLKGPVCEEHGHQQVRPVCSSIDADKIPGDTQDVWEKCKDDSITVADATNWFVRMNYVFNGYFLFLQQHIEEKEQGIPFFSFRKPGSEPN
jgi:hypothetical protein